MAKVELYEHSNYGGSRLTLTEAEPNLHDRDFGDKASSIRVRGNEGKWVFYEHTFFRGSSFSLRAGASRSSVGDWWNDRISSVVYQPPASEAVEEEEETVDPALLAAQAQSAAMWQPETAPPMTMQKVRILRQDGSRWLTVVDCAAQFNPTKLKLTKKANWKTEKTWKSNIGNTTFTGGNPIDLSVTLFFDTTETGGDVRQYTEALMGLTMIDLAEVGQVASEEQIKEQVEEKKEAIQKEEEALAELNDAIEGAEDAEVQESLRTAYGPAITSHENQKAALERELEDLENQLKGRAAGSKGAPPKCKFVWGSFSFLAIVQSVNVTFTMFLPNGRPVRAQAKVKMKQIEEQAVYAPQNPTTRSAPMKVWTVKAGQTLDWIAYQEYGDPSLWRYLARINDLDNPRDLTPGQVLKL